MSATHEREALRQQALLSAIASQAGAPALQDWMRQSGPRLRRGLQAYRANLAAAAERALASSFPTVQQLVGAESFGAMARAYVHACPPAHGDLARLGEQLPGFIAASESLGDEPYLADVARLDWAVQCAEGAAHDDAPAHGLERLADTDPARLRMRLRAGTAVLLSPHPVASIWLAHRSGDADRYAPVRAAFAAGLGEGALVWRSGWRACVAALAAPDARFLLAVLTGASLAAAVDAAGPAFHFEALLVQALQGGWLAAIETMEP